MDKFIEGVFTFIALVVGLIMSFIIAIPFLILRYGAIVIAVYIVYKIATYLIG